MRRVLVAGASGYLGGYVVRELHTRGDRVRALVRDPKRLTTSVRDAIDDVFVGEVTQPETLERACDGIDIVFSSVGVTRQKGNYTCFDVDYQGNKNLLKVAEEARVAKMVYVSVFNGPTKEYLALVKAHEDFVRELTVSRLDYSIIRPTGYFSDMGEFFAMARSGRVYLFGDGTHRINPIHGADLAGICVDSMEPGTQQVDVGGPEILTYRQIAEAAFDALGQPARIFHMPHWVARSLPGVVTLFSERQGNALDFLSDMMLSDVVAPPTGTRTLKSYFDELATEALSA
jgi:uncharacterized protein YbjT (DUF2867 family)